MPRHVLGPGPGRPKGVKNKRTMILEERLEALGCDPLAFLAEIMMDEKQPVELRMKAAADLMPYTWPKRRAIEHTNAEASPQFVILGALPDATAEAWEARNQAVLKGKPQ